MELFNQFPQIGKNLYLAIQPRDGGTIIINVAIEIKTIKTRHIYKHLISGKIKEPLSKTHFNKT